MKNIVLVLFFVLTACGKFEGDRGPSGEKGDPGESITGKSGEDALVKSEVCSIELVYPGDTAKYKMVYVKLTFGGGHSLASLRQYNVATKKIVTQVSAAFEAGEEPWLESPNWHVSGSELTLKPSGTKYSLKCS